MDAAIPLCRIPLLAAALAALLGCQSDGAGLKARGQQPQDPLGPIAPVAPPSLPPNTTPSPLAPIAPAAPAGVAPAATGAPVAGSPVPPGEKGEVIPTGFRGVKNLATAAEMLKNGTPRVKVVAIVGSTLTPITDQEVRESVWQQYDELARYQGREREEKEKELYAAALRRIIERELILDEMYTKLKKANKLNVIEEIREYADQITSRQIREMKRKTQSKSDEEFAAWLRVQGLTVPVLRRQFERQIMAQQYLGSMFKEKARRVGLAEVRDYYESHPQEFQKPDRVKWQHIFVSLNKHPTAQAAYTHAESLRQKLADGADFAALARQFDDGLAGQQNGFGTGEKRGEILPADLEPTVWSLKPGQLSGVLQTPTGYHIVKVVERDQAGVQPFDAKVQTKIRDKLNDALTEAETKKLVEELWRKGVVRVIDE